MCHTEHRMDISVLTEFRVAGITVNKVAIIAVVRVIGIDIVRLTGYCRILDQ